MPRKPHPAIALLREHDGDVKTVARLLGMKPGAVHSVAYRYGLSIQALRYGSGPVTDTAPPIEKPATVTIPRADYIALVAQATSAGRVWAEQERVIESLTRALERYEQQWLTHGKHQTDLTSSNASMRKIPA